MAAYWAKAMKSKYSGSPSSPCRTCGQMLSTSVVNEVTVPSAHRGSFSNRWWVCSRARNLCSCGIPLMTGRADVTHGEDLSVVPCRERPTDCL